MAEHHDRDRTHVTDGDRARTTTTTDRGHVTDRDRAHPTDRKRGGTNIAALLGALAVAVLLAFWLFSGDGGNEAEISQTGAAEETEAVGMGAEGEMDQPVQLEEPALETETAN